MSRQDDKELPFYFGASRELFGLFHATTAPASKGVLLCPPLGQDQIRCHRLYRQLAHALVAEGIAVLRFDYYGTGDSAGASVEVDWDRCVADTITAANELRVRSGALEITAFGARLGGSIALAAAKSGCLAGLVAWDPVLDGSAYVARLDDMQKALAVDTQRFTRPRLTSEVAEQWLGFATSDRFRRQLVELRLEPADVPMLVLDSLAVTSTADWQSLYADSEPKVLALQPSTPWDDLHRLELAILSHPLIRAITGYFREAA
ncbi:serine aminopeptidase domain-containing protein [Rhodanobacter sp. Col0626]|uniref:serine aminopeptidase domain-containing protein n=1 Tax=Rhodanobacter sp. Col0626 TaxID=3415679 RepID=UPI003CFAA0AC